MKTGRFKNIENKPASEKLLFTDICRTSGRK